ncbi:hypothetical protein HDU76_012738 [Blyttiomyces sp. JEL0837]|nr:hypothetical protein HDU76_012738 [Blyttiomyces sp. JEL0837]
MLMPESNRHLYIHYRTNVFHVTPNGPDAALPKHVDTPVPVKKVKTTLGSQMLLILKHSSANELLCHRHSTQALLYFANANRAIVTAENPGLNHHQVTEKIKQMWSQLTDTEKSLYKKTVKEESNMNARHKSLDVNIGGEIINIKKDGFIDVVEESRGGKFVVKRGQDDVYGSDDSNDTEVFGDVMDRLELVLSDEEYAFAEEGHGEEVGEDGMVLSEVVRAVDDAGSPSRGSQYEDAIAGPLSDAEVDIDIKNLKIMDEEYAIKVDDDVDINKDHQSETLSDAKRDVEVARPVVRD